jgi:hypothetical protein
MKLYWSVNDNIAVYITTDETFRWTVLCHDKKCENYLQTAELSCDENSEVILSYSVNCAIVIGALIDGWLWYMTFRISQSRQLGVNKLRHFSHLMPYPLHR